MKLNQKLIALSAFSTFFCFQIQAEEIYQVKGKRFIFNKESSQKYTSGQVVKFYDSAEKLSVVAKIQKCNASKCMAQMMKRRKGFRLAKGEMIYPKSSASSPRITKTKSATNDSPAVKGQYKYAVKGGLGGHSSASIFGEFDYISSEKWVYGLSVSNRIMSRDDLEVSGLGFGGRVDYHFDPFSQNGFMASANLGLVNLTYSVVDIEGVSNFEESESVPYFTLMGGYKMWFDNLYMTFAGGLSYVAYKESFEDPSSNATFTNPYSSMDLALEISLAYPF